MKKDNKELQSRREFFKNAAKGILPIIGSVILGSAPLIVKASETQMGCGGLCQSTCTLTCASNCRGGCETSCRGGCQGRCYGSCYRSCSGGCQNSSRRY
ncbi:Cys-Xaa-Xaa-Xaa repeat radical SAM target protein [Prevotella sp. PCHR]|uniref:Cys-Xaa-Xaa-Xaa repeat radical SAM target protein n=2 Tax=Xylanibacter caecicola TaxID=2736294 RepID=A0ABX2B2K8_9BACT|nr:Cys-Xaa-Xaa-Xaa repeat radical SAM target protein [Xylanibacter caecicola]